MLSESRFEEIYIACGYTDLRYGIDGLATTVKEKIWIKPIFTKHHLPFLRQTQRPNQSSCLGRRWLPAAVQTPGSRYIQMAKKRR